ncbi:lamin tail domain-containing protein 1 isoform X1 [Antechinus flavipes]|uniref:lamin tail domain-containing protein 1 isoform X1 n=1 Tax=Antechinus flavipes TaxID=38775 RepID=UPI002235456A|nr:lamin tail domain-containing protein 1 isoform X1 [Antechinus flavipes]XP_051857281.1 lamin tail domain-containing protein 1 isoform X1 [Antechinus flavipes]XP_051857282.1 lamin tail domain-containing protein 1 isoform X1 [Antechinus flavipes]
MKKEKSPQKHATILKNKVHLQSEVHDLGSQPNKEYRSEEKGLHSANLQQQSPVHFLPFSSDMSLKSYVSSSLSSEWSTPSFTQKSPKSSSTDFSKTDNIDAGSLSELILQETHFAVGTSQSHMLGEGEDYFHSLFFNSKRHLTTSGLSPDDSDTSNSNALGDIKIVEVSGLFVKIINSSPDKELTIGDHILQQNVNGRVVSFYRFHPNIRLPANAAITVWAAASKVKHQPPSDFLWKEQDKFRTSTNCTTILCKPNGEAIAWYSPIHWKRAWERFDSDQKSSRSPLIISSKEQMNQEIPSAAIKAKREQETASMLEEQVRVFLKREKEIPPSLFPNRSPWGLSQSCIVHPNYTLFGPLTVGNDGTTVCRQSVSQSAILDLKAGGKQPYH